MYYYKDKDVNKNDKNNIPNFKAYDKVKSSGKDPKTNSLGSFEVTNRPCGPAASESSKFAFTFQVTAQWRY